MRRLEIINGIDRILSALVQSNIAEHIEKTLRGEKKAGQDVAATLESFHKFSLLAEHFSVEEHAMLEILGLRPLLDPQLWAVVAMEERTPMGMSVYSSIQTTVQFLPRFKTMLEPDYVKNINEHGALPQPLQGKVFLSVIAIEERDQFSTPRRVIEVIESVTLLYEACAILDNQSADDLLVLTCDSGSDKSFDFLGAAKIVEQVKELILGLWDKVVFFRERKAAERIDLVAKSLPIIERISEMKQAGTIPPEKAEIVTRKVIEGAEKFLKSGATIPEIANRTSYNPRMLLAPQTMLLTGAVTETPSAEEKPRSDVASPQSLSETEQAELQRLLNKMRGE